MTSAIFNEDIQHIVENGHISWEQLNDSVLLVTGATGLVGGALVRTLSEVSKHHNLSMKIIAHGRNFNKGQRLADECNIEFLASDICEPELPNKVKADCIDYIFHCAAITKSADLVAKPVDVMALAVQGTRNVLELAKDRNCNSFVYLSSMEIYGQIATLFDVTESDLGYIDLSNPRTSYPESKRFCENLCVSYASQYNVPVKIARLAMTFGAGTPNDKANTRAPMQFAKKALAGKNIVLHTEGNSVTNCCYTADAITGLLAILFKGRKGEAYNIANPSATVTIKEMAELAAKTLGKGNVSVVVDIPKDISQRGYAPDTTIRLNVDKLINLGWQPKYGLAEMFGRMAQDWQESY